MQLFLRSFFIAFIVFSCTLITQAQSSKTCPSIVLDRCNEAVTFTWSADPESALNPALCRVGLGGSTSVGSTCGGTRTLAVPVVAGTYGFNGRGISPATVYSATSCSISYAAGIDCSNPCRDGIDNDSQEGTDAADVSCNVSSCPTGSATVGGTIVANPGNNESFICGGGTPPNGGATKFICGSATAGASCTSCVEGGTSPTCPTGAPTYLNQTDCESSASNVCGAASTGSITISAVPNPVQICSPATSGTTNIRWTAPSGQGILIYRNGEGPWANVTGSGNKDYPYVERTSSDTFSIRKAETPVTEIASVTVTGTANGCSVPSGLKCVSDQCVVCGGSTGVACGTTGSCVSAGATCSGIVTGCGNGITETGEQCDLGEQNGVTGSGCSSSCTTVEVGVPFVDIGFNGAYSKSASVQLTSGQTTTSKTIFVTSRDISQAGNCDIQKQSGSSWNTVGTQVLQNTSSSQAVNGLTAGTHNFRYSCANGQSISSPATLTVISDPSEIPINIGWNPPSYSQKTMQTTAPGSGTVYITTGGRSGCSLIGNFTGSSQTISANPTAGYGYSISGRPLGTNTYTLSCPGVASSVSADLIVQLQEQQYSCIGSGAGTCQACDGGSGQPACSSTGIGSSNVCGGVCPVDVPLETTGWQCSPSNSTGPCAPCGGTNQECESPTPFSSKIACESSSANSCGPIVVPVLNAACAPNPAISGRSGISYSPKPALSGRTFNVSFGFINSGTENWIEGNIFRAKATGFSGTFLNLENGLVGGSNLTQNPFFSTTLTAPTLPDGQNSISTFPLNYVMTKNNTPFGTSCEPDNGVIEVRNPECNDGIDNSDSEDVLIDCADNGCWTGGVVGTGVCDKLDDNEKDPVPGVVLKISANPQLVRQRGNSTINYEVNQCEITNEKGNKVSATWELRDGTSGLVDSGTGTSNGQRLLPVTNILNKTTFTLSCGGSSRSATISVIKINEI